MRDDLRPGEPGFGVAIPCKCQAPLIAERAARNAEAASDAPPDRADCRFDAYDPTYNGAALQAARAWADGYASAPLGRGDPTGCRHTPVGTPPGWLPWLILEQPHHYGAGKTHLLGAAYYALLDAGRRPIYAVTPLLLDHIRDGIQDGEYGTRFYAVRDCPLLILDDLGAENSTPWANETLYKLVDYRYRLRLPLAVATNLAPDECEPRVSSRLHDRRLARIVRMQGPDWRLR